MYRHLDTGRRDGVQDRDRDEHGAQEADVDLYAQGGQDDASRYDDENGGGRRGDDGQWR